MKYVLVYFGWEKGHDKCQKIYENGPGLLFAFAVLKPRLGRRYTFYTFDRWLIYDGKQKLSSLSIRMSGKLTF